MLQQFKNISTMVHQQLNTILDDQKQAQATNGEDFMEGGPSINIKDLVNDFNTGEFVHKNVRVRPTSSASGGLAKNEDGQRGSSIGITPGEDDEERKYNVDQQVEININRLRQKDILRVEQER
jgi:hypothetical protein